MKGKLGSIAAVGLGLSLFAACTINPVTGQRELALVSAEDEVAIGIQQYQPSQQMQGGEYRRDPALTSYVRSVGNRLAAVSDRALPYEFVIINSSVPNAWALPGGKIAINRGLLVELESEAELAAVLGHEIVHAAARHGAQSMQRGILLSGAVLVAGVAARNRDYSDLAVGAAGLGARLVNMRHGRGAELEADAYGMAYMSRAGYDPRAAIDLQRTFLRLSEGRDTGGWLSGLFRSHPPSSERVAANEQTARSLPASGTLGRDAYMNATAGLRRARPGYEALDRATEALANGNLVLARQEARAAEEIIPDEATVASLLGDIEIAASAPEAAIAHYDRALRLDSGFFYSNLARGEANLALARLAPAESDFERSLELLPTSRAYLGLGRIAEAEGNRGLAIEHYTRAAESSGSTGIAARMALIRLDLPENPERYLSVASSIDANGQLIVEVRNRSLLAVTGIELDISYVSGGQVRAASQSVAGVLEPDVSRRIATGLGPFASSADFQVAIERALAADNE